MSIFGDYILWFKQEGKESDYAKTKIWKSIPAVAEDRNCRKFQQVPRTFLLF